MNMAYSLRPLASSKDDESQSAEMILHRLRFSAASTSSTSEASSLSTRPSSFDCSFDDNAEPAPFGNDGQLLKDHKLKEMLPHPAMKRFRFGYKYPLFHMSSSYEDNGLSEDSRHSEDSIFSKSSLGSEVFSDSTISHSDNEVKQLFQCLEQGFGNGSFFASSASDDGGGDELFKEEVLEAEFELRKDMENVVLVTSTTEEILPTPSYHQKAAVRYPAEEEPKSDTDIEVTPGAYTVIPHTETKVGPLPETDVESSPITNVEPKPETVEPFREAEARPPFEAEIELLPAISGAPLPTNQVSPTTKTKNNVSKTLAEPLQKAVVEERAFSQTETSSSAPVKKELDVALHEESRQGLDNKVACAPEIFLIDPAHKNKEVRLHEAQSDSDSIRSSPSENVLTTPDHETRPSNESYQEARDIFCDFYRAFEILFCCGIFYGTSICGGSDTFSSEAAPQLSPIHFDSAEESSVVGPASKHRLIWFVAKPAPFFIPREYEQKLVSILLENMDSIVIFTPSKRDANEISTGNTRSIRNISSIDATRSPYAKFVWKAVLVYVSSMDAFPLEKLESSSSFFRAAALSIIQEASRTLHVVYTRKFLTDCGSQKTFTEAYENNENIIRKPAATRGKASGAQQVPKTTKIWSTRITVGGKQLHPMYIHGDDSELEATDSNCTTVEYCNTGSRHDTENSFLFDSTSSSTMFLESTTSGGSEENGLTHLCSVRIENPSFANNSKGSSSSGEQFDIVRPMQEAECQHKGEIADGVISITTNDTSTTPAREIRSSVDGCKTAGPFCDVYRTFEILFCCGIFYGPPLCGQMAYSEESYVRIPSRDLDICYSDHCHQPNSKDTGLTYVSGLEWVVREPRCYFKLKECEDSLVNMYFSNNPNSAAYEARDKKLAALIKSAFHEFLASASFSSDPSEQPLLTLVWSITLARIVSSVGSSNTGLKSLSKRYWHIASWIRDVADGRLRTTVYGPPLILAASSQLPFSKVFKNWQAVSTQAGPFPMEDSSTNAPEATASESAPLEKESAGWNSNTRLDSYGDAAATTLTTDPRCGSNCCKQFAMEIVVKIGGIPMYSVHIPSTKMAQDARPLPSKIRGKATANDSAVPNKEEILASLQIDEHPSVASFLLDQYYNEKQFLAHLSIPKLSSFGGLMEDTESDMFPSLEEYMRDLLPRKDGEEIDDDISEETQNQRPVFGKKTDFFDSLEGCSPSLLLQAKKYTPLSKVFKRRTRITPIISKQQRRLKNCPNSYVNGQN